MPETNQKESHKKKQVYDHRNYPNPQKSADSVPSKYTKGCTTKLNFQIWNKCFPNQFHQPKSKSGIDLGITQDKPKVIKTKLLNR